jgi:hypothetical protein
MQGPATLKYRFLIITPVESSVVEPALVFAHLLMTRGSHNP